MIELQGEIVDIKKQCELLSVPRSSIYYQPKMAENNDALVLNEIREIYQKNPFFGYRKIHVELAKIGHSMNLKKVQRLLTLAGIRAIYPTKKTTIKNPDHAVYPYLLRDLKISFPNQVWQTDITYIKMRHGFVYLVALIDVFSRKIMGWSLSPFLDTGSCLKALSMALRNGKPEIINSDQGCQFTSAKWIGALKLADIAISMDGKGRWVDNVFVERLWRSIKYEAVFLHSFDTVSYASNIISAYIDFYNNQRPHQALNYHTPNDIYELKKIPTKKELFEKFEIQNTLKREVSMTSLNA